MTKQQQLLRRLKKRVKSIHTQPLSSIHLDLLLKIQFSLSVEMNHVFPEDKVYLEENLFYSFTNFIFIVFI